MNKVFFKPWIGENYYSSGIFGKKILVLGESHDCDGCNACGNLKNINAECRELTSQTIRDFLRFKKGEIDHQAWMKAFTNFGNIVNHRHLNAEETNTFWNSVLYYNYVQSSTGQTKKTQPYKAYVRNSAAFFQVIDTHKPDLIIVLGKKLWDLLPSNGEFAEQDICVEGENRGSFYYFPIDRKKIPAYMINHPSSQKFDDTWHPFIHKAIELA